MVGSRAFLADLDPSTDGSNTASTTVAFLFLFGATSCAVVFCLPLSVEAGVDFAACPSSLFAFLEGPATLVALDKAGLAAPLEKNVVDFGHGFRRLCRL